MATTNDDEAIVESDQEIQGRKRVSSDKDVRSTKKVKVDVNETTELPVRDDDKAEEAAVLSDDELNRLRGLLADGPKELSNKDVEGVICYLEVDEIIRLALKSAKEVKRSDVGEWMYEGDPYAPCSGTVLVLLKTMLRRMEKIKEADFCLLYENFRHTVFAPMLLLALDSYSYRCCGDVSLLKAEDRAMIPELCHVLPWKLFAHVVSHKTLFPVLEFTTSEETSDKSDEEVCTRVLEQAAESCDICLGKGKHRGPNGHRCSFRDNMPKGGTVGPNYWVVCIDCGRSEFTSFWDNCIFCGSEAGKAVPVLRRPKI